VPPRALLTVLSRALLTVLLAGIVLGSTAAFGGVALAAPSPPPPPPPNPSDQQLGQSKQDVTQAAGQVGRLTGELAAVQAESDRLGDKLEGRQETANKALVDLERAQGVAAAAQDRVRATHADARAAASAIERMQAQLDQFIAVAYEQGVEAGSMGLLMEASDPDELVQRAELTQAVADQQKAALEALQRARIAKVNADSLARAAQEDAESKRQVAQGAKWSADGAVATARAAVTAGLVELHRVDARKAEIEHQLDTLTAHDSGLRAQRQRYLDYQEQVAAAARAEAAAAAGRVASGGGGGGVGGGLQAVIDRAVSQVGTTYAWGGGTKGGPSRGIRDGGVADSFGDFRKTGFDCSGLMIYAFGAAGIGLPHFSGYQYNAGKKVPISKMRPGDMLFWGDGGDIHHVAMFIGNGRMVEAPYSGGKVRVVPVRYGEGLMPYATRLM
jgi:cell wall-associated NlpC family hydrolase